MGNASSRAVELGLFSFVISTSLAYAVFGPKKGKNRPKAPRAHPLSLYDEKQELFVTEPNAVSPIRLAETGLASEAPVTVIEAFERCVRNVPNAIALKVERGPNMEWQSWTFSEYLAQVQQAARALIHLGMQHFQSVNIIGFNSPEWVIGNMAAIYAGGKAAGIYTTNGSDACRYIVEHSEAAVVLVENKQQLDKFLPFRDQVPSLKAIVQWSGPVPAGINDNARVPVYSWAQFMEMGDERYQSELQERIRRIQPGHCCTLIYTSGTTGNPKAVMISHDNVTWDVKALMTQLPWFGTQEEHVISYLPLSHIAAQVVDIHGPISLGAWRKNPVTVWFARPDALRGSLKDTLTTARPTFFFGVPRVWEKFMEAMQAKGAKASPLQRRIASWCKAKGLRAFENGQTGGSGDVPGGYWVAERVVFSKVRQALGLDRCHMACTGAAPIHADTIKFFGSLGIPLFELYGMSEVTGASTICVPSYYRVGSCGPALPGVEIKIEHVEGRDKPGEGEICMRGRTVMMGYMKDPEKTRETIDEKGYLHSGDVGRLDEHGMLYITGRIKELIITAGGENIAPVPIEDQIKQELPAISNIMMVGDRRKYNVALVTLKCDIDPVTGQPSDVLVGAAKQVKEGITRVSEAINDPDWRKYIEAGIQRYNKVAVSNAQKIQKFAILPTDFSIPGGELTATLKMKRQTVSKKYEQEIEKLYAGSAE
eukprot:TRINITY_DN6321_c0_g1_i4.p1 TRINITY_DN6321_c0_g1~~TRINITY_DN6321_c0_g1_i4.p1  ORF type:complete len:709 (+),score=240.31 TRINITY_DN6321_c0_g1_i4:98-2224(+)